MVGFRSLRILGQNSFGLSSGEFASILGKSGCGKSTLLRAIAGLDMAFEGKILLGEAPITGPGLDRGMIFQEPRLMPWMTVQKNIEFAIPKTARNKSSFEHVKQLIHLVGLDGFNQAWPNQLSGGMAQRVALARALVNIPDLLLLDEPFGALDSHTKISMQTELERIVRYEGTTTLMVTHDVEEALFLSDTIIIMSQQPGSTSHVISVDLERPRSRTSQRFLDIRTQILEKAYHVEEGIA
ncbi:ABC transporter ATP-binding protein [cf. Phormidesmis sp. LEGE 11477]|uniref:ABC transporter ATP-binding protein n=1 Tax=cf. Phormidesmis sp. LEGE 11477 TaxID=1828680 RepID=UPI00187E8B24|nr:ABC transporter ATP-binding protein [cf. Phormidesmis sp. LEGE 11477]MBE9061387.1 ABC transporter ATP-binding protein [cf. Phormidesmis sp. LEGE 11477]